MRTQQLLPPVIIKKMMSIITLIGICKCMGVYTSISQKDAE